MFFFIFQRWSVAPQLLHFKVSKGLVYSVSITLHISTTNTSVKYNTLLLAFLQQKDPLPLVLNDKVSSLKGFSPLWDISAVTSVCPCIRLTGASHSINRAVCPVTCSCKRLSLYYQRYDISPPSNTSNRTVKIENQFHCLHDERTHRTFFIYSAFI